MFNVITDSQLVHFLAAKAYAINVISLTYNY